MKKYDLETIIKEKHLDEFGSSWLSIESDNDISLFNNLSDDRINNFQYSRKLPGFVVEAKKNFNLIVDNKMLLGIVTNNVAYLGLLMQQLRSITEETTINISTEISVAKPSLPIIIAIPFIISLVEESQAEKKIFNFGYRNSLVDLAIATCCDSYYIGDFSSIFLVNDTIDSDKITPSNMPVFEQFTNYTLQFWKDKGLLSVEEYDRLYSKSSNSVSIYSDTIKQRLIK